LLPSNIDEGTYNSFFELDGKIIEVAQGNKDVEKLPYYIKADSYILVGFNKKCSSNENDVNCPVATCHSTDRDYFIPKPRQCSFEKSCLCLFSDFNAGDFDDESNEPVVPCISYDSVDYLVGRSGEKFNDGRRSIVQGIEHESLVIYGECGDPWKTRDMKIEKTILGEEVLLILGA